MKNGKVVAIYICPTAGGHMQEVQSVLAIVGAGLEGDRYTTGEGSWSKAKIGKRQVTLSNARHYEGSGFGYADSRRNIIVSGIDLMRCIGREFRVGRVLMRGVKYCEPCARPSVLSGNSRDFAEQFEEQGGLIADILSCDYIVVNDDVVPPPGHADRSQ